LPPLRERKDDIPLLVTHFLHKCSAKLGQQFKGVSSEALREMITYSWPGNIRELEHVIEQAMITSSGKLLELARPLQKSKPPLYPLGDGGSGGVKTLDELERDHILNLPTGAYWAPAARQNS
jgi:DNA-binding NtrC family response regulator